MDKTPKKADFFLDGQNLFFRIKALFGYSHPNFDVVRLCEKIAHHKQMELGAIHFYTGMPSLTEDPHWHSYWTNRLAELRKQDVVVFNPPLQYIKLKRFDNDGRTSFQSIKKEKGIDVKIALDMVRKAHEGSQAMVILSRDNDLAVAVQEVERIAEQKGSTIRIISAYPVGSQPSKGIENTDWLGFDHEFYKSVIDDRDFRPDSQVLHSELRARVDSALRDPRMVNQSERYPPNVTQKTLNPIKSPLGTRSKDSDEPQIDLIEQTRRVEAARSVIGTMSLKNLIPKKS